MGFSLADFQIILFLVSKHERKLGFKTPICERNIGQNLRNVLDVEIYEKYSNQKFGCGFLSLYMVKFIERLPRH